MKYFTALFTFLLLFTISGKASYYSRAGCLGCSPNMTMANGQTLDDSKITVALPAWRVRQFKLMNKFVLIKNIDNGKSVYAKVTDTGGFEKYGKIADLNLGTKKALSCKSTCNVEITY